ncbi:acetyltransferase (GNAT) family protein [Krasilnikovia cinnamomea]|uniref:Acetyltransferase (GNAT) family protein n=1 Tax=Krasilnikovia cinnamomea TaxID=349313 RepID=A0A4Q7ZTG5_9ACTN|nr:GNAT family N-acetyltransferase [Krasilnikovia cinnamomea]RZU54214.1 acetyltransferase (GNAT) family protein [Krasilnikovia cinnamomea]
MNPPRIRAATAADVDAVVPLMLDSSPELIAATFGAGATAVVRRDFLRGRGIFGHAHQLVALADDGRVVATLTAYPGRDYRRLSLRTLRSAAVLGPRALARAVRRTAALAHLFAPPGRDSLFLANLCVAPAVRSRGYGSALMAHARTLAPAQGLATVEFDVSFANPRAQRLYERLGWEVTGERPAPAGSPLDGFRRMRRPAAPGRSGARP